MPRSSRSAHGAKPAAVAAAAEPSGSGDVYTMAEAAQLKGVSYHTVSRAVRRGKLPAQRLGRMALIAADDLRDWRPMRERAPHKYRRREPNPDATPALLDLASGQRVELARRLSTLYEVLHGAAAELPLPEFLALLTDRLAVALDFRRVAIWGTDRPEGTGAGRARRLATFGGPLGDDPDEAPLAALPIVAHAMTARAPYVIGDVAELDGTLATGFNVTSLFIAPLRVGDRVLGVVLGDCNGEPFTLSEEQLVLAQGMANQAALALDRARLRAAEESRADQLAAIIENVGEAVFAVDAAARLTVINAAGRALFGLDDGAQALGQNLAEFEAMVKRRTLDGRPLAEGDGPLLRAAHGERSRDTQHTVARPDGTERAVSVNAQPILDATGAVVGAVAVARDITSERTGAAREAERLGQLQAAAARAAAVADVAQAVNTGTDLRATLRTAITRLTDLLGGSHGAIFFREAGGRMTGQVGYRYPTAAEVMDLDPVAVPTTMIAFARRTPLYYTYAEAAPSERVYFDRLGFRAAIIVPLIVGDELIGVAYVNFAREDHRPAAEELSFAASLAHQCAVAIDKTRLMERLESAHRRLLTVVDQLPQAIAIVEAPSGRLALANRAAEDLWGGPLPDAGGPALGFAAADGTPFPPGQDPLTSTLAAGRARSGETLTLTRPDGRRVTVLANHVPILDAAGRTVGAVSVLQDAGQLRALDRAKDEFLSVAAHELRNPLTSLHGNLQLLLRRVQRDPERAEDAERVATILAQSDRLGQLVGRLLDASRAELGRLDLELGPADAVAIVRRVAAAAGGLSTAHRIVATTPDRLPVVWDELRIEQVLANLVANAVKYAPGGEVRVSLEATADEVRITVRDHGPGIADAAKARLFERYYRAAESSAEAGDGEGLGLGLYISRLIARSHAGDLTVADAPGGGALFVLTLPLQVPTGAAGDSAPARSSA